MTIPFYCVLVAYALIYVPKFAASIAITREGHFDNHHPRDQQTTLTGWKKRAMAAHYNTIENFAPFAAAVFVAHLAHASESLSAAFALVFVAARVAYPVLYIADLATPRSAVWGLGVTATALLFLAPLFH